MSLTPIFHQARKQVSQTKSQDRGKQGTDSLKGESMLFLDEMRSNIRLIYEKAQHYATRPEGKKAHRGQVNIDYLPTFQGQEEEKSTKQKQLKQVILRWLFFNYEINSFLTRGIKSYLLFLWLEIFRIKIKVRSQWSGNFDFRPFVY